MKLTYIVALLFLVGTAYGQQPVDEILAENVENQNKAEHTILASEFSQFNEESLDGIYKLMADNGKLKEIRSFEKGQLDGTWLEFDEQENLIAVANYKDGQKHGKWIIWDSNGTKRYELHYLNGNRTGQWKQWSESGELLTEKSY